MTPKAWREILLNFAFYVFVFVGSATIIAGLFFMWLTGALEFSIDWGALNN